MRVAEARRQASVISSSSIKLSFAGGQVGCTMNTSRPRTFSINSTLTSPSLNRPTCARPKRHVQMPGDLLRQQRVRVAGEHARWSNRTLYFATYIQRNPRLELAGVEGFEPPYGGIKTRCLTAWRHPNLKINRQRFAQATPLSRPPISQARASRSVRAPETLRNAGGNLPTISRPCVGSQAIKTQAPVPVRRAAPKGDSQSIARATSGYRRRTTAQAIVPTAGRQETVNCDGRGISCQFRILEHVLGADESIWLDNQIVTLGRRQRRV